MKIHFSTIITFVKTVTTLWVALVILSACEQKEDASAPIVEYVRPTRLDSVTSASGRGSTVAIIGKHLASTQKVFFNDEEALLNTTYITETNIIVRIPETTPYQGSSNKIRVVTRFGETTTNFTILQPTPEITGFFPDAGTPGDTVTITGKVFENLKEVKIGDLVAPVISSKATEIKIKVPDGVKQGSISVTTGDPSMGGGTYTTTENFGFGYLIYDDLLNTGWYSYNWSSKLDVASTEKAKRGKSIKVEYTGGYAGLGMGTGDNIDITKYKGVKLSIYVPEGSGDVQIKFYIKTKEGKDDSPFSKVLTLKAGVWNDLTLDFKKDLSSPDLFQTVTFQEWGNTKPPTIYIDNFGLV